MNVLKILIHIKEDKSPEHDEFYPRVLCEARVEIAGTLVENFASPLDMGEVPKAWRVANVVSLFRKCNEDKPGNYRTMSLTSVVGKLQKEKKMAKDV